jgi:class 3 adenylate cyclase
MVTHQTNRTFICSTVFVDLVEYSKKSVTEQLALKDRFTSLLAEALQGIDVNERIILDTGDGAAMSFLGDPESALFVGMSLRDAFNTKDPADPAATAPIRIGINLGPVKLVKDINGHPNIVGDGINVAQRIMSFADSGQILVSRSFHDVVSCLSDDYAALFRFEGSRTDKHVRDHEVYAVGDSEAALARAKRGVAQRAEPVAPAPRPEASTAAGETLRRAQAAATTFLHDRHKVTLTGGVLGALIVVLAVVLVVRKPAEVRAAAAPAAGAPAQVAAQDAAEKAPAATGAAASAVAAKPAPARPAPAKAEAPTGTVGLAVLPWGEVFVNGRSRGVSPPLKNLKLAPGTYTIEVRNTTFAPLKQKVQVKAREEVTVRHVFK